ncbi:RodZ family helix-turn-helix domain-containing protein [Asticcacaulis sp. AC402]|uniref:helix-turn-helix domain-containing protein n=1 Tax=Asticcacaulis sp. AC402 TaxID=1282361 RepID=UPI0003C3B88C|nr:helix-turn-helix transcriptional regulator [Asticcacaulis sp. AC402]ESQ73753.1 hypothetical protein ABAC402_17575 [Asticcacaulis sp. AC402]
MSTSDHPPIIEDEPYQGIYRGESQPQMAQSDGRLPDRFDLAELLKARRALLGLTLEEVSDITRVRRAYLEAFEQVAYDVLPPRAFAIGYVKAYAKALGLDEESLADMYKREVSEPAVRLHAPSGASVEDTKPNYRAYLTAAACVVGAVVIWNVVQHRPASHAQRNAYAQIDNAPWKFGVPNLRDGMIQLTRPAAAPQDQDVPLPYVTPGLEEGFASIMADANASSTAPVSVTDVLQARKAFNPQGAIYGAPPERSNVTLQATKSVDLIIRDGAGSVISFATQLNAGEAYRLPAVDWQDKSVQVSDLRFIEVYYNGEYAGQMDSLVTTVGKLNGRAAQMASVLDARQAQAGQVAVVYKVSAKPEAPKAAPRQTDPIPYLPAVRPKPEPVPVEVPPPPASSDAPASASATTPVSPTAQ